MRQRDNDRWIALGHMASGIAHDIRNPIRFRFPGAGVCSEKKLGEVRKKSSKLAIFLPTPIPSCSGSIEMIQGLLDYGRAQTLDLQIENASAILIQSRDKWFAAIPGRSFMFFSKGRRVHFRSSWTTHFYSGLW